MIYLTPVDASILRQLENDLSQAEENFARSSNGGKLAMELEADVHSLLAKVAVARIRAEQREELKDDRSSVEKGSGAHFTGRR